MGTKCTLSVVVLTLLAAVQSDSWLGGLTYANNDFAMRLYKRVVDNVDDENVFFSPFSISIALAMTYGGTRGKTAAEIGKALWFEEHYVIGFTMHQDFRLILEDITRSNNDNCNLLLANRLFPDQRFKLLPDFVKMTTKEYSATTKSLDFARAPDTSRRYINKWAADATEHNILNLLSARDVTSETALVLASAISFEASWRTPFDKSKTTISPFYVSSDFTANITMMQTKGRFRYLFDRVLNCQYVELPYAGSNFNMILIVPLDKNGLRQLERNLTQNYMAFAIDSMKETTLTVKMPKFNITQRFDLVQALKNMGIHELFSSGSANLSGLAEDPAGLAVSGFIHKAYISVNEDGTEAAAATTVVISKALPKIVADKPFMFLIRDVNTASILFMGRIVQPPREDEETIAAERSGITPKTAEKSDRTPNASVSVVPCLASLASIASLAVLLCAARAF